MNLHRPSLSPHLTAVRPFPHPRGTRLVIFTVYKERRKQKQSCWYYRVNRVITPVASRAAAVLALAQMKSITMAAFRPRFHPLRLLQERVSMPSIPLPACVLYVCENPRSHSWAAGHQSKTNLITLRDSASHGFSQKIR